VVARILHGPQRSVERTLRPGEPTGRREAVGFFLEDLPRAVGGAVVVDDDFVRHTAQLQFEVQVFNGGRDAAFLVARGNNDG